MRRATRASVKEAAALTVAKTTATPPRKNSRSLSSKSSAASPSMVAAPKSSESFSLVVEPSPPRKRKREVKPKQGGVGSVVSKLLPLQRNVPSVERETIRKLVESRVLEARANAEHKLEIVEREGNSKDASSTVDTHTMGGWCLVDALVHCANASNGILAPLILEHGPPGFYVDHLREQLLQRTKQPPLEIHRSEDTVVVVEDYPSFRSLCRTVAGQQLAGAAAETIWRRLLEVVIGTATSKDIKKNPTACVSSSPLSLSLSLSSLLHSFTPNAVLAVVESDSKSSSSSSGVVDIDDTDDTDKLRKPAGLSKAKCGCILSIAECFRDDRLSESFLRTGNDQDVRSRLLAIKGLGPWSVDMFLMFRCHRSNILPIGDLAVRNGTAALWKVSGSSSSSSSSGSKPLCAKKDAGFITELHAPFAPYRSISSYYMYKVADACKQTKRNATKHKKMIR